MKDYFNTANATALNLRECANLIIHAMYYGYTIECKHITNFMGYYIECTIDNFTFKSKYNTLSKCRQFIREFEEFKEEYYGI